MQELMKRKPSAPVLTVSIVLFALALVFCITMLCLPSVMTLMMSFKDYFPMKGVIGSPDAGLSHYLSVLSSPSFSKYILNTCLQTLLTGAFAFILSMIVGHLTNLIRIRWLRHALCTLLLVPLVIPGEIWAYWYIGLFGDGPGMAILAMPAWCALKYTGLAVLLMLAANGRGLHKALVPLLASAVVSLILLASLGRFDFNFFFQLPSSLKAMKGIDYYSYYVSFASMHLSEGSALSIIVSVIRFVLMVAVAWPVILLLRKLFPATQCNAETSMKERLFSTAAVLAAVLLACIPLMASPSSGVRAPASALEILPTYIGMYVLAALINTAMCYFLAQPLACMGKTIRFIFGTVLLLLTAVGLCATSTGEFFFFTMLNAHYFLAILLNGIGSIWGVWALVIAAKSMGVETLSDWHRRMWKPALALLAVQAALMTGNMLPSLFYMDKEALQHPLLQMWDALSSGHAGNAILPFVVIPTVMLLAVRTAFKDKDSPGC